MEETIEKKIDILDILLNSAGRKKITQQIKMKRLSEECGKDVIFTVKPLDYDEIADIKKLGDGMRLQIILQGVVEPNLKDERLCEKYGVPDPEEVIKKTFFAGEIEDISMEIERLSGYRDSTIEIIDEVKKK